MFYPTESLKRGGRFYLCWVADSWPICFAKITHRQLWSQDIRQICDDLLEVVRNESGRTKNRYSLRLSSQLLRGLVRLYQRKITVFAGDLCMISALVMKSTHKKLMQEATKHELPRLEFDEQVDDDKIVECIKNSGNTVAHVQDITMIEPTLPENRALLDDGFGELHPDQALQILVERSVEMMLVQETSAAHHSGIDLPDLSADKSHDKSRLLPNEPAQMERISEHEMSIFRKSVGEELIPAASFEKEILEIPEIPPSDFPALHTKNQKEQVLITESPGVTSKPRDTNEIAKEKSTEEIVLEDLVEKQQVNKRKLKNKLIIDTKTKLGSNFLRSRIEKGYVELRCEDSTYDIISIFPTSNILLNRAAHCGPSLRSNLGYKLSYEFARNLGLGHRRPVDDDMEEVVATRTRRSRTRSTLEKTNEKVKSVDEITEPIHPKIQDISKEINISDLNIRDELQVQVEQGSELMDISDLPTQRILTTSQAQKRASDNDGPSPKRQRRSGYMSYRLSLQIAMEISSMETNKENIPDLKNRQQDAERVTEMLVDAGLADIQEQERPRVIETKNQTTPKTGRNGSETSETPLGSLDRTKVSLGDSDETTDLKRFIREEWGTLGTMYKIYRCIKVGVRPLDVRRLVARGPAPAGQRRLVAARCFASVLKLKQHGFISIIKDVNTYEIKDIALGSKITLTSKK